METVSSKRALKMRPQLAGLMVAVIAVAIIGVATSPVAYAATLVVNSTADAVDANPGDDVCADGAGNCTLRAAIMEANALAGPNIIILPTGTTVFLFPALVRTLRPPVTWTLPAISPSSVKTRLQP